MTTDELREAYGDAYVEYLDSIAEADAEDRLAATLTLSDATDVLCAQGLTAADIAAVQAEFVE